MDDVTERWLPVSDYEGLYEVSDQGRVRSLTHQTPKGIRYGRRLKVPLRNGYPRVGLYREGVQVTRMVHDLVTAAFLGPRPEGTEVRHLDGNPQNATRTNLAYGTHGENQFDQVRHGTHFEANQTHCPADHEYTPENTKVDKQGRRHCRKCQRARRLAYAEANPESVRASRAAWVARNSEFVRTQNRDRVRARRATEKRS
jgi:hypothetical protein